MTSVLNEEINMSQTIELRRRSINKTVRDRLLCSNLDPKLCDIIAARPVADDLDKLNNVVNPKLAMLDSPFLMQDMHKAVKRLIKAIENRELIGIETDHDCDGQTSHAVIFTALTEYFKHPEDKITSYISHRLTEGYGLCEPVAKRILKDGPTLVITADNGSSDEPRIQKLKKAGIDVIVTDHHALPKEGPPESAYACLNPTRKECQFPDPFIAGCMVAWLFMAATKNTLQEAHKLDKTCPSMAELLDFVAVGTVADCVSLSRSINNRSVIRYGLTKIQQQTRPCWQAILSRLHNKRLYAEDLGFKIGPLLNSDGRLANAFGSVSFLLAKNNKDAANWANSLTAQNAERKAIQKTITDSAMIQAKELTKEGMQAISIYLADGHAGVHGISASRIKDTFGRPTVIFSPKQGEVDIITGSCRSIDGVHMQQALCWIDQNHPKLLLTFGGHHGAAGLSIKKTDFKRFSAAFDKAIKAQIGEMTLGPFLLSDGLLESHYFNLNTVDLLRQLDPYGREFEKPLFEAEVTLVNFRLLGESEQHVKMRIALESGELVDAIWFNATGGILGDFEFKLKDRLHIAFTIEDNSYRGTRSLQLFINHATRALL